MLSNDQKNIYCICQKSYDGGFMIECEACKEWFHGYCVGLIEDEAQQIDVYHCTKCRHIHGPSRYKYKLLPKPGTPDFINLLKEKQYACGNQIINVMRSKDLTTSFLRENGFNNPILIEKKENLGLQLPPPNFNVKELTKYIDKEKMIDVIDVHNQVEIKMRLRDWLKYYTNPFRDKIYNVISLEVTDTELGKKIKVPRIVRKMSWVELYWPKPSKFTKSFQRKCPVDKNLTPQKFTNSEKTVTYQDVKPKSIAKNFETMEKKNGNTYRYDIANKNNNNLNALIHKIATKYGTDAKPKIVKTLDLPVTDKNNNFPQSLSHTPTPNKHQKSPTKLRDVTKNSNDISPAPKHPMPDPLLTNLNNIPFNSTFKIPKLVSAQSNNNNNNYSKSIPNNGDIGGINSENNNNIDKKSPSYQLTSPISNNSTIQTKKLRYMNTSHHCDKSLTPNRFVTQPVKGDSSYSLFDPKQYAIPLTSRPFKYDTPTNEATLKSNHNNKNINNTNLMVDNYDNTHKKSEDHPEINPSPTLVSTVPTHSSIPPSASKLRSASNEKMSKNITFPSTQSFESYSSLTEEYLLPPCVEKYCLMSVKDSYTDWHIDFGGSSVWYHVLRGEKIFYLVPPTPKNLKCYEEWSKISDPAVVHFDDMVETVYKCTITQGQTIFLPSGWIHAVLTPVDSLVFGGNFLHSYSVSLQLSIYEMETRLKTAYRFMFPYFDVLCWLAAKNLTQKLNEFTDTDNDCICPPPLYLVKAMHTLYKNLKLWEKSENRFVLPSYLHPPAILKDMASALHNIKLVHDLLVNDESPVQIDYVINKEISNNPSKQQLKNMDEGKMSPLDALHSPIAGEDLNISNTHLPQEKLEIKACRVMLESPIKTPPEALTNNIQSELEIPQTFNSNKFKTQFITHDCDSILPISFTPFQDQTLFLKSEPIEKVTDLENCTNATIAKTVDHLIDMSIINNDASLADRLSPQHEQSSQQNLAEFQDNNDHNSFALGEVIKRERLSFQIDPINIQKSLDLAFNPVETALNAIKSKIGLKPPPVTGLKNGLNAPTKSNSLNPCLSPVSFYVCPFSYNDSSLNEKSVNNPDIKGLEAKRDIIEVNGNLQSPPIAPKLPTKKLKIKAQ